MSGRAKDRRRPAATSKAQKSSAGDGRARKTSAADGKAGPSKAAGAAAREQARLVQIAAQRRRERRTLALVAIAFVLVVVGGGLGLQAYRTGRAPQASTLPVGTGFAPVTVADGRPLLLGRSSAPVTLTLYEDFHCPHCADLEESLGPTITDLQNAGTLKVELYPMAFIDDGSFAAASALACAAERGFGQPYYLGLFANHTRRWSADQLVTLGTATDPARADAGFATCVRENTHRAWVDTINQAADAKGVTGTPTAFLDGAALDVSGLTADDLRTRVGEAAKP